MLFDLVRLRHVVALASQRSFTRAAEQLHISQPALSRSISEFERRADVRLFERNRGGIELTAVGRQVVAQAEDLLRSAEAIDLNVAAPVITLALIARLRSRDPDSFSDKLLASLRNAFGGHAVRKE